MLDPHEMFQETQPSIIQNPNPTPEPVPTQSEVASAFDKAEKSAVNLVEAISWYVWQSVHKQFSAKIQGLELRVHELEGNQKKALDRIDTLESDVEINSVIDERINSWARNHLDTALDEHTSFVDTVLDSYRFGSAVESVIDNYQDNGKLKEIVTEIITNEVTFEVTVS